MQVASYEEHYKPWGMDAKSSQHGSQWIDKSTAQDTQHIAL